MIFRQGNIHLKHPRRRSCGAKWETLLGVFLGGSWLEQKLSGLDKKMAAQESLESRLAGFDKRMEEQIKVQQEQQEKELSKQQEIERSHSRGFGIGR